MKTFVALAIWIYLAYSVGYKRGEDATIAEAKRRRDVLAYKIGDDVYSPDDVTVVVRRPANDYREKR